MKFEKDAEEFEFKPLTEGLGFHPRSQEVKSSAPLKKDARPTVTAKSLSGLTPSANPTPALEMNPQPQGATLARPLQPTLKSTFLETPLPRPSTPKTPASSPSGQAVETLLKSLSEKNQGLRFQDKGKPASPYLQVAPNLASIFLDFLLVTSLGLIYMMSLVFLLKIDLVKILSSGELLTWLATGGVFLTVGFIYYTSQRIFLGFTLGEWAYEQRLGLPEELTKNGYTLKVVARHLFIIATGIVLLPLISWATGRDWAGMTGLCLYRKR